MVHDSTLAGSRVLHYVTLSVHFSTLAGSRVIHQLSHRSTFLHLLGPELYTSFLTGPLFYTCWVHDSTLGFYFNFWSILLHQLGPELYTSFLIGPLFYTCWVQNSTLAISLVHFSTLAGSRIIHQLIYRSTFLHLLGPELYTRCLIQLWVPSVEAWTQLVQRYGPFTNHIVMLGTQCRSMDPASVEVWSNHQSYGCIWYLVQNPGPSKCRFLDPPSVDFWTQDLLRIYTQCIILDPASV